MSGRFPPSAKRLREARARGEVAHSPLLAGAAALTAGAVAMALVARPAAERLTALMRRAFAGQAHASEILPTVNAVVLPIALAAFVAALAAGLVQTRGLFAWSAIGRRERHDDQALPIVGWAAAAFLALAIVASLRVVIASAARAEALQPVAAVAVAGLQSLWPRALVVLALAGLGDYAWRRARLYDALSMSRAERERERREEEGDPRLRAEQRRRQRAVARDPLVDDVARAQVVLLTEGLAVALRESDGAARIAAGTGEERLRAQRLAAIARRLGIPLRVDDELAAALASLPAGALVPEPWQARALALVRSARRRA